MLEHVSTSKDIIFNNSRHYNIFKKNSEKNLIWMKKKNIFFKESLTLFSAQNFVAIYFCTGNVDRVNEQQNSS